MCRRPKSNNEGRAIQWLEGALFLGLLAAAGICAGVAATQLQKKEKDVAVEAYTSIAEGAAHAAQLISTQKLLGANAMATLMGEQFPNAEDWPFIKMDGYIPVAQSLASLSGSLTQAVVVSVAPDQIDEFNAHAKPVFEEAGYADTVGVSDFGFGLWKPDQENDPKLYEDGRIPDTDGKNWWGSENPDLQVVFLHSNANSGSLMMNAYAVERNGRYQQAVIDCTDADPMKCFSIGPLGNSNNRDRGAGVIRALLFHPIYPRNNPGTVVGVAPVTFDWSSVLTKTVPSYVDGLICVIKGGDQAVTFHIEDGTPNFLDMADVHNTKFDEYKVGPVELLPGSRAPESVVYTIEMYPSDVMFSEFQTNQPAIIAISFVAVICVVAGLFLLYDMFVRRELTRLRAQEERYKTEFARRINRGSTRQLIEQDGDKTITSSKLQAVFDKLDKDGSGTIDYDEMKAFFGDGIDDKDFDAMWKNIDLDNNKTIDFAEFCSLMAEVQLINHEA